LSANTPSFSFQVNNSTNTEKGSMLFPNQISRIFDSNNDINFNSNNSFCDKNNLKVNGIIESVSPNQDELYGRYSSDGTILKSNRSGGEGNGVNKREGGEKEGDGRGSRSGKAEEVKGGEGDCKQSQSPPPDSPSSSVSFSPYLFPNPPSIPSITHTNLINNIVPYLNTNS
jgi:hypothetical protein